jgi:hypothetical protein
VTGANKTISVYNPHTQHRTWSGGAFNAQETTQIDPLRFKHFLNESAPYGTFGLEYDHDEFDLLLSERKEDAFAEFESKGIANVSASVKNRPLSKGDEHLFALEWLESKEEERKTRLESRDRQKTFWAAIRAISATGIVGYLIKRFWGVEF